MGLSMLKRVPMHVCIPRFHPRLTCARAQKRQYGCGYLRGGNRRRASPVVLQDCNYTFRRRHEYLAQWESFMEVLALVSNFAAAEPVSFAVRQWFVTEWR